MKNFIFYTAYINREKASTFSKADVDANVVMAFRNNQPGTVGIAWGGSVCDSDPKWRTSLNEYFIDDLRSGQVTTESNTIEQIFAYVSLLRICVFAKWQVTFD